MLLTVLSVKGVQTVPPKASWLYSRQQQARFDKFIDVFNNERPLEALDMKSASRKNTAIPGL
jgi:hypothetical protein